MFTYINENFLHAPSTDLSRDTVKTLIQIMLAQAQEVFLEKQIADGKKVGLLAKLASQAGYLFTQAVEGVQELVNKAVFEKVWLLVTQVWKTLLFSPLILLKFCCKQKSSSVLGGFQGCSKIAKALRIGHFGNPWNCRGNT